jgi:hypothetical protein
VALRLAKAGWWGGDVAAVEAAPVDDVLDAAEMESCARDFEAAYIELNRGN